VGVGVGVGVGETFGTGIGEGVGFTTDFFCQTSVFPTFLQTSEPDVEFILVHFEPNLGVAPWEFAGIPRSKPATSTATIFLLLIGILSQMWSKNVKMWEDSHKVCA